MDSFAKWEFKCPQFIDFNDIDKFDPEVESYFDKNSEESRSCSRVLRKSTLLMSVEKYHEESRFGSRVLRKSTVLQELKEKINVEPTDEVNSPETRKRSVYTFTAAFSKPKVATPQVKNKENPFMVHTKDEKKPKFRRSPGLSKASRTVQKPLISRPAIRTGVQNARMPVAACRPITKTKPPMPSTSNAPPRRRIPSPPRRHILSPPPRRKTTRPQTPQCLKRSMMKASSKVIKTSEQLELERIAEMRRKMKTDLNINKAAMKKTRTPALRPLPEKKEKPVALPKTELKRAGPSQQQDKKNDVVFKKPAMLTKAKSFIAFGTRQAGLVRQNTNPYGLRPTDRRITHSDSSTPSTSKLNANTSKPSSALTSLSVCHSGVMFIPKQAHGAIKMKPSGQENKTVKPSGQENKTVKPSSATPRKEVGSKPKPLGSSFQRNRSIVSKAFNTSQPLRDKTNSFLTNNKNAMPPKVGIKRMSSESLIRGKGDKRIKTN